MEAFPQLSSYFSHAVADWRTGRTVAYGKSELKKSEEKPDIEEEYINGVLVKHYN